MLHNQSHECMVKMDQSIGPTHRINWIFVSVSSTNINKLVPLDDICSLTPTKGNYCISFTQSNSNRDVHIHQLHSMSRFGIFSLNEMLMCLDHSVKTKYLANSEEAGCIGGLVYSRYHWERSLVTKRLGTIDQLYWISTIGSSER